MKLKVVLEPSDEGGYTACVPSLPGCIGPIFCTQFDETCRFNYYWRN